MRVDGEAGPRLPPRPLKCVTGDRTSRGARPAGERVERRSRPARAVCGRPGKRSTEATYRPPSPRCVPGRHGPTPQMRRRAANRHDPGVRRERSRASGSGGSPPTRTCLVGTASRRSLPVWGARRVGVRSGAGVRDTRRVACRVPGVRCARGTLGPGVAGRRTSEPADLGASGLRNRRAAEQAGCRTRGRGGLSIGVTPPAASSRMPSAWIRMCPSSSIPDVPEVIVADLLTVAELQA